MINLIEDLIFPTEGKGMYEITTKIRNWVYKNSFNQGQLNLFIKHTSASLTINENADPSVRDDFETHFNHMVSENENYFTHVFEGTDDMTSHIKSSIIGSSVSFPVSNGKPNFGAWQGIYLCEHRNSASSRRLILTVIGE